MRDNGRVCERLQKKFSRTVHRQCTDAAPGRGRLILTGSDTSRVGYATICTVVGFYGKRGMTLELGWTEPGSC